MATTPLNTILLVDDDALMRDGVQRYLRMVGGYVVVEAATTVEAQALARTLAPVAAVVDITLTPNASRDTGLLLARQLKNEFPALGIVLFSAFSDYLPEVLRWQNEGRLGIAYLLKGCPPSELLLALQTVLSGRNFLTAEAHVKRPQLADEVYQMLTAEERH